jgi:hypothetical protein
VGKSQTGDGLVDETKDSTNQKHTPLYMKRLRFENRLKDDFQDKNR